MHRAFASFLSAVAIFVAVSFVAGANPPTAHAQNSISASIGVREAYDRAARGEIQLVDIRRPSEWRQTGIAKSAIPLTMHQDFPNFLTKLKSLSVAAAGRPIAIICAAGVRTSRMQRILARHGLRVVNVSPGMTGNWLERGWIQSGLPVKRIGK